MVLKMLDKLTNVEKLTFGPNILQVISFFEFLHVPFPSIKVKDLTVETSMSPFETPGTIIVLQNSPNLKKLTVHTMDFAPLLNPLQGL
ncbi:hypothetical protein AALP_AAs41663U000100 [Arabis alpina]|uniref:FBD domain-containing protein n=1 Tax=Arabis alpina TaxID=50452 RepID=A0A087FZM2_ARAAL|nr:hypothetical protein AALP_AAs41663U000100 [Arabis alpina]